jgi:hypothetical protein
MNTSDLLRQLEALLVTHEDKKRKAEQGSPEYAGIPAPVVSKSPASAKKKAPTKKLASAH